MIMHVVRFFAAHIIPPLLLVSDAGERRAIPDWDIVGGNVGCECAKFAKKSSTDLYWLLLGGDAAGDNSLPKETTSSLGEPTVLGRDRA